MNETVNLTQVSFTERMNDDINFIIEEDSELKRFKINDLDISGDIVIDLNNSSTGQTKKINAEQLGGFSAEDFVRKTEATQYLSIDLNNASESNEDLFSKVDNILKDVPSRAGFIYPLATRTVPSGFLLCDGGAYSREEYPELFAAIGTIYGEGDGIFTFNVPDLQTRVPVGSGDGYDLGNVGGEANHILTEQEMPSHNHIVSNYTGVVGWSGTSPSRSYLLNENDGYIGTNNPTSHYTGGNQPHNNMQPYTVINYIIATGKKTGVSVSDVIIGAQAIPLGVEYGGTGATNIEDARRNLEITPENIGAISMELLWENASPTSEFVEQNISIPNNYNNYICFSTRGASVMLLSDYKAPYGEVSLIETIRYFRYRQIQYTRAEGKLDIAFSNSQTLEDKWTPTLDNTQCIPYKIYGIKGVSA